MDYEQKLRENANLGANILKQFFKGGPYDPVKVKTASIAITQYQRFKATQGANKAIDFQMARVIAKDREELKQLSQIT